MEEKINFGERIKKFLKWFENNPKITVSLILIFAFALRLYFFFLTKGQAVWWDEGEYMLRVNHIIFQTPQSGFFEGRELFTPYFWALIMWIFKSEVAIRFVQVIISTLTVFVVYLTGKEIYQDRKIGYIAAFLTSVFWLHLFFTCRLLTYLYAPLFYPLALFLFWKGYVSDSIANKKKKERYLFFSFLTIVIGVGIYSSIALSAFAILAYLLVTERFGFLKKKVLWINALKAAPFFLLSMIPSYFVQGSLVPRLSQIEMVYVREIGAPVLEAIKIYPRMMPRLMLTIFLIITILSFILFIRNLFFADFLVKNKKDGNLREDFFVFLGMIIPYIFYTWYSTTSGGLPGASYDAWILPLFVMLFIYMARFLVYTSEKLPPILSVKRVIVVSIILIVLLIGGTAHILNANSLIKGKASSYYNLKPAGEWLKENSSPEDIIISSAVPELTYYSQRMNINFDFEDEASLVDFYKNKKPPYLVLTLWEKSPEWAYNLPNSGELNLQVEKVYFLDEAQTQPDVVIYKINY